MKRCLSILLILGLISIVGFAITSTLAEDSSSSKGREVQLTYRFKAGAKITYKMLLQGVTRIQVESTQPFTTFGGEGETASPGGTQSTDEEKEIDSVMSPGEYQFKGQIWRTLQVQDVDADGNAVVRWTQWGVLIGRKVSNDGEEQKISLPKMTWQVKVTPAGKVEKFKVISDVEEAWKSFRWQPWLPQWVMSMGPFFVEFPQRPLKVGESWTEAKSSEELMKEGMKALEGANEGEMPADFKMELPKYTITTKFKVLRCERKGAYDCAVIERHVKEPLHDMSEFSYSPQEGEGAQFACRSETVIRRGSEMKQTIWFALNEGIMVLVQTRMDEAHSFRSTIRITFPGMEPKEITFGRKVVSATNLIMAIQ